MGDSGQHPRSLTGRRAHLDQLVSDGSLVGFQPGARPAPAPATPAGCAAGSRLGSPIAFLSTTASAVCLYAR
jgi:hypothetical protein